jgi:hypothetical protein
MMKTLRIAALSLLFTLTTTLAHAVPFVLNGDFQTPGFSPWSYSGEGYQVGVDITGSPANHASDVFVEGGLNSIGILSQTIFGLTVGAKYTLTFELQRWSSTGALVNESLVRFGGATIMDEVNVLQDWTTITLTDLVATSTSMLLEFGNISKDPLFGTQLDNILLDLQAVAPPDGTVPEPASLGLLGVGLILLGAARRRFPRT